MTCEAQFSRRATLRLPLIGAARPATLPAEVFATSRLDFRSTTTYRLCCKYRAQYEIECVTAASPSCSKGLQALRPFNRIAEVGGQVSMSCVLSYTAPLSLRYYEFLQAASGAFCSCGPCSCLDRPPRFPATTPESRLRSTTRCRLKEQPLSCHTTHDKTLHVASIIVQ